MPGKKVGTLLKSGKQRDRGAKKDKPKRPKKALSAYMFFAADMREQFKQAGSTLKGKEILMEIGRLWKVTAAEDKVRFEEAAAKDKARYDQEIAEANEVAEDHEEEENKESIKMKDESPKRGKPPTKANAMKQPKPQVEEVELEEPNMKRGRKKERC